MRNVDEGRLKRQRRQWVRQYKILTQKDRWFGGKFDPNRVEEALNAYAQENWRLAEAVTASFPGFFSQNREELIIILERETPE
jgi:hypothetical protein